MVKKGDTLIEVVLAVGIFSLVAVAVVAVMTGGTSGAQSSLEITLAREEIDTQAEALRFIQAAYIADKDSGDDHFRNLWQLIKQNAVTLGKTDSAAEEKLLSFSPSTCSELYDPEGEVNSYKAFVLNPRKLGENASTINDSGGNSSAYVSATGPHTSSNTFHPTETYPRLVYGGREEVAAQPEGTDLLDNGGEENIAYAEGLYIIAVADASNTVIVSNDSKKQENAFYDFYIRSCWYGTDADHPSTISTVIRLYNPDALDTNTDN